MAEAGTYANFEIALTTAGVYAFVYEDSMWVAKQITDLSGYATTDYLSENYVFLDDYNEHLNAYEEVVESVAGKQDTLTAGDNISIENNVISATAEPATQADIIKALAEADAWRYDNSGYILVYKPDNDNLWYNERTESTTDKGVVGLTNARLISNPGNDNYTEFMVLNVPQPMPADCYLYFGRSSGMSYINTSHWDTSAVTSLSYTFYNCSGLTSLDVSGWDTSALTSLYCTFNGCSSLTVLDVSNWDTSSLAGIYLYRTFCGCSSLTSLDLSSWDTSKVTDIKECFRQCSSLTSITFGDGWDLSGCSSFQNLFYNCTSLTDISGSISGISYNLSLSACGTLTTDSLTVIINGLTDLTDSTSQTLTLNTASKANLTDELIELATSKNWSIS